MMIQPINQVTSAGNVAGARPADLRAGGGATPTSALQSLQVRPIPLAVAKELIVWEHYLHSLPGGTQLAFGVFLEQRLLGALTLGAGPANAYALVAGAARSDCLTLTRLWLSDELPTYSESRVLGVVIQALRRNTPVKFLVTYSDPAQGHLGTIYQATNWLYTGRSQPLPSTTLATASGTTPGPSPRSMAPTPWLTSGSWVSLPSQCPRKPSTATSTSWRRTGGKGSGCRSCLIPILTKLRR
jgi:hypothetical protein